MSTRPDRPAGLTALDVFVGEWSEQVLLPEAPAGTAIFEWALDGQYLLQHAASPAPDFPDSLAIVAYDPEADSYLQHYFDSRGVVRVYRMDLRDGRPVSRP